MLRVMCAIEMAAQELLKELTKLEPMVDLRLALSHFAIISEIEASIKKKEPIDVLVLPAQTLAGRFDANFMLYVSEVYDVRIIPVLPIGEKGDDEVKLLFFGGIYDAVFTRSAEDIAGLVAARISQPRKRTAALTAYGISTSAR